MQEQKEAGDSVVHTVTTGQTERPQDREEQRPVTSGATWSRSTDGSLINRRELVDVFSEWLVRTYSGVNPLPMTMLSFNYDVILREARRRGVDAKGFLETMLDDVISAYAEETEEAIEMAYREEA